MILAVIALAACSRNGSPENGYHPYGVQHGTFHFEYIGMTRGTLDLFIDSFGLAEARDQHTEMLTPDAFRPTITYSVRHGADITIIDSVEHQEIRLLDRVTDSLLRLSSPPTTDERFSDFFTSLGYHHAGDTSIQGFRSRIWTMPNRPDFLFEYHGVLIGSRIGPPQFQTEMRLVSFDTIHTVDRARFTVPKTDFSVKDLRNGPATP